MPLSSCLSKAVIISVNFLFWGASGCLIFLGVWMLSLYAKFEHLSDVFNQSLLPAYLLLAVGVVVFAVGTIGCVGVVCEHKFLVRLYFSLLLIGFVGLVFGIVVASVCRGKITGGLHDILKEGLNKYDNDTECQKAIDTMQRQLHCCGVDNYTDWLVTKWHASHDKPYPESCCVHTACNYTYYTHSDAVVDAHFFSHHSHSRNDTVLDPNLYPQGCYTKLRAQFSRHMIGIFVVFAITLLAMLVGLISARYIMLVREDEEVSYSGLTNTDGTLA